MPPPLPEIENTRRASRTPLRSVSPEYPCPTCSGDHKCSVGDDGDFIICGRKADEVPGFIHYGAAEGDTQFHLYRRRPLNGNSAGRDVTRAAQAPAKPAVDWARMAAVHAKALTPVLARELAAVLGLPVQYLPRLGVGYVEKFERWTFPEKDAAGLVVGISTRDRDGSKRMLKGSSRGLCFAEDWDRSEGPILVPEGPSDWATLYALGRSVVGRPSSTGGIALLTTLFRNVPAERSIIIVGENDRKPDGRWPGREGAEATAERLARALNRSILIAFPPDGDKDVRDWFRRQNPDLARPAALEKLGDSLLTALRNNTQEVAPWDSILEIDDPDLPTFPTEALAPWQRRFVEALAVATQTPVDLGAMLVLSVAGAAAAKRAVVRVREGYDEPLNIYAMVAQPPASRKTSVFREVLGPVEEYERELATMARPAVAQARSQFEIDKRSLEEYERRASKSQDEAERSSLVELATTMAQDLASRRLPEVPRYLIDDATPESLVNRMFGNGGRIFLASPEGGLFEMIAGRYSQGKSSGNLSIYLKGHAGDQIRIDRMNRPPEFIDGPALSIGIAVQPDVVHDLASNQTFKQRGLLGRFLYSLPRSLVGRRLLDPPPVPCQVRGDYRAMTRALLTLSPTTDEAGEPVEHVIHLSAGAYARWLEFVGWLEPQLGELGPLGHISDWAGKLAGAVVRIVGLLHLADRAGQEAPWSMSVSDGAMARAIEIGHYLIPHARAAFAEMGADPTHAEARHLLAWVRREGVNSFKRKDAFEATKGRFKRVECMEPAFQLLVKHNYLRLRPIPARTGPGRPIGPSYDVNPATFSGPAVSAPTPIPALVAPEVLTTGHEGAFGVANIQNADPEVTATDQPAAASALEAQGVTANAGDAIDDHNDYEEGVI